MNTRLQCEHEVIQFEVTGCRCITQSRQAIVRVPLRLMHKQGRAGQVASGREKGGGERERERERERVQHQSRPARGAAILQLSSQLEAVESQIQNYSFKN